MVGRVVLGIGALLIAVMILYPLLWLFIGSIGGGDFTFRYFAAIFSQPDLIEALLNTLWLVIFVAIVTPLLGVPLAWLVARTDLPWGGAIEILVYLSFIFPSFLSAVAFVLMLGPGAGLINQLAIALFHLESAPFNIFSLSGIIFVTVIHVYPFVFLLTLNGLRSVNPSLEDAARIHGGSSWQTTARIVLPIVAPSILAGVLLATVDATALFGIQAILGGPYNIETVATKIYDLFGFPSNPQQASALSLVMVAFAAAALYVQRWFLSRRSFVTVGGKGARRRRIALGRWRWPILGLIGIFFFVALVLPTCVLLAVSFMRSIAGGLSAENLTVANYLDVFSRSLPLQAMYNSVVYGVAAATVAVALGFVVAYADVRTHVWWRRIIDYVSLIPLGLPGIVLAVAMILAWTRPPWSLYGTAWILILAYVTRFVPLAVRTVNSSLVQVHDVLERAARISGATWVRTQFAITLPLVRSGLFVAWLLVFIQSLRELSASILLFSRGRETLAIAIFNMYDEGLFPQTCALSLITLVVTLAAVALARMAGQGRQKNLG